MPIHVIWKKPHPTKMHRHFTTRKTVQNWELPVMRILYINLWTFVDLCSISGAFSDPVSNVFLNLREIIFPTRGHTTTFKKIDYMPIFCAGPWVLVAHGTLKNSATKKNFVQKLFLTQMDTFGKCTKKMKHFC